MAFPAAEVHTPPRARWAALGAWWSRAAASLEAYPLERIGLAALAAGIVLRIAAPFFMDFRSDGDTYTAMGQAWALHHQFVMPYGDVTTWGPLPPGFSNHYPPAYPFYLGLVFSIFGFGLIQAKAAAVFMALLALAAVYFTTRDLYGPVPAALAAGLIGLEPHLVWVAGSGFSENMVLLFFCLTMWGILRSLTDDRYILYAGLFAALAYLSRASVGYFFAIAGAGGFLWRFYYRRWKLFTNYWYMGAIVIFLGIAGAWAWRNVALFGYEPTNVSYTGAEIVTDVAIAIVAIGGLALAFAGVQKLLKRDAGAPVIVAGGAFVAGAVVLALHVVLGQDVLGAHSLHFDMPRWETSSYTRFVQQYAIDRPDMWKHALVAKVPFFLAFAAWYVVPFAPEAWRATKRIKEEHTSALWLSVFLVWVIAWVIASMFWVFEQSSLYWFDNHRYVVIGLLPLAWLLIREARWEKGSTRLRYILVLLSLFAACGATFLDPVRFSDLRAAEFMDPYLHPGDEVGVDGGTIKYAFYAYLTHPERIQVYGCEGPPSDTTIPSGPCHGTADGGGKQAHFIVSLRYGASYSGYQLVGTFRQKFSDGGIMTATLFARDDVVAARNLPTNVVKDFD